jgi:photosystem II stability/assembly factor-like uncharacterized protein
MRRLLFPVIMLVICAPVMAQSGWKTIGPAEISSRYDDIFFINDTTGWLIGDHPGKIYSTSNGGNSWTRQATIPGHYLRSIEFVTARKGFCGSLDSGFFKTTDGGNTWIDIRSAITPRIPGICGLSAPDSTTIYGCGIWYRPAFIIKSTDGGNTWSRIDMSAYASGLVDILFINKDTGWVSGISPRPAEKGIILHTTDGGSSWQLQFTSSYSREYVWKLQTPDRRHFFASIQGYPNTPVRMARSTDGGKSWLVRTVTSQHSYIQAIGFLTAKVGFIGGSDTLYQTNDGGFTWSPRIVLGDSYNRFFRINDHLAFLTGSNVYKFNAQTSGTLVNTRPFDEIHALKVFPNPASDHVRVEAVFRNPTTARLEIFDAKGELLGSLFEGHINADSRTFLFPVAQYPAGTYFVILRTNEGRITRTFIKQ